MATSTAQGNITGNESIVAGYFASGEDAHLAIQALLDEGFLPSQIGAAFHSGAQGSASGATKLEEGRGGLDTTYPQGTHGSGSSIGGPASDTTAVQPSGLAAGSGLPFAGVGREKPITGSSLEHTGLPSELGHELPHDNEVSSGSPLGREVVSTASASYAGQHHHTATTGRSSSWTDRLKHLFTPHSSSTPATAGASASATPGIDTQNFGTGEGSLGLVGQPYSATGFASSASRAGVPAERSQTLSQRLARGGAVVTVSLTGRLPEVERIFERFGGDVRFESAVFSDETVLPGEGRVEVFGHLEHFYPTVER